MGYRDTSDIGLIANCHRPTLHLCPPDSDKLVDTGISLVRPHAAAQPQCIHAAYGHGLITDLSEIDPFAFAKTWVTAPPALHHLPLGTPLHIRPRLDSLCDDVHLPEGIACLQVRADSHDPRPGAWIELYNPSSASKILQADAYVARLKPLHSCPDSHHCSSLPLDGSYEDPLNRDDGPFTFEVPAGMDPHALSSMAMDDGPIPDALLRMPTQLNTTISAASFRPETSQIPDAEFLAKFPASPDLTEDQRARLHDRLLWYRRHKNVWSHDDWDIGTAPLEHDISLKAGAKPIKLRPYRVNAVKQEMMHQFLAQLVQAGVLEEGTSPWGFPLLMAKKPGRDPALPQSYRLLCDFRVLNDLIDCPSTPLPIIDELVRDLGMGNAMFSSQDLTNGFYAVRLTPAAKSICTIVSPTGLSYQFRRLPQGLKTSPNFFSQLMVSMFTPLRKHTRAYIDDLVTATPDFDSMLDALCAGWDVLHANNIKLKPQKCVYGRASLAILGWDIDAHGRRPQQGKMDELRRLTPPTTVKELQSGLGLLNYYRNYVHRYAEKAAPLLDLLRTKTPPGAKFSVTSAAVEAWHAIVHELSDRFALNHPTDGGQLRIYSDASDVAIGAVLVEYPADTDMDPMTVATTADFPTGKVLAFCSKTLTDTEKRYTVSDRELLAVVYAVEKFHTYLHKKFQVVTDHAALEQFKTIRSSRSPRLQRYAMFLSGYCLDLLYRKGSLNVVADALSRLTVDHTRHKLEPTSPHLLTLALYSQPLTAPVAVTPVIGGMVAVRPEHDGYFMKRFGVSALTNQHRYGVIKMSRRATPASSSAAEIKAPARRAYWTSTIRCNV